jgi:Flp pilus assembly pilin Flp
MRRPPRPRDEGATAVEFALVLPLAVLILAFVTAAGMRVFWAALSDNATRAAAHYASLQNFKGCYPVRDNSVGGLSSVKSNTAGAYGGMLGTPTMTITNSGGVTTKALCYGGNDYNGATFPSGWERCGREGDVITVTTTYHVPGLSGLQSLVNGASFGSLNVTGLASVTHTATARCE